MNAVVAGAQTLPNQQPVSREEAERQLAEQHASEIDSYADRYGFSRQEATDRLRWQQLATNGLQEKAERSLGAAYGGIWIDEKSGRPQLGVAGETAALKAKARNALVESQLGDAGDTVDVAHGQSDLDAASAWIQQRLEKANTDAEYPVVFGTKTNLNAVDIQVPAGREVNDAQRSAVQDAVERFGSAVRVGSYRGEPTERACWWVHCSPPLRGGVGIMDPESFCTSGFVAVGRGSEHRIYVMTAGHCRNGSTTWFSRFADGSYHNIGPFQNAYDGLYGDAGIIQVNAAGWNPQPWVYVLDQGVNQPQNDEYKIRYRGASMVGQDICTSGAALQYANCGKVQELGHYNGVNGGLTRGSFCGVQGDSGAPMWKWDTGYGLHTGGYSFCDSYYVERSVAENLTNTDIAVWTLP